MGSLGTADTFLSVQSRSIVRNVTTTSLRSITQKIVDIAAYAVNETRWLWRDIVVAWPHILQPRGATEIRNEVSFNHFSRDWIGLHQGCHYRIVPEMVAVLSVVKPVMKRPRYTDFETRTTKYRPLCHNRSAGGIKGNVP